MSYRYTSFGYDGATPMYDDSYREELVIKCELCDEECADNFEVFREMCLCPECHQDQVERQYEAVERLREEMSELF